MEGRSEGTQRLLIKEMAKHVARPVKARHTLATLGSKTRLGGEVVTASTAMEVDGHCIACVGDVIRYPDGSESRIVSGAGSAAACDGRPLAIVGSAADNGDIIANSLQNTAEIHEYTDGDGTPGLLQPGCAPPPGRGETGT